MSEAPDLPPLPKLPASHADPSSLAGLSPTQARKLKVGSSCIVWGTLPRPWDDTTLESAIEEISAEGLSSFETFPEVLSSWDRRGMLNALMERFGVPLRSGYITGDLTHPEKRKDEIVRITRLAKIIQRFGGSFVVLAPSIVVRETFSFREHREHIVSALNDYAAAITELGLETGLHQHTGTAIESRDEVYAVMEAVNTEILKFAP
ncbi:MAG TPA: hypothetical protein VGR71_09735, partial [Nitrospira sp.]|nr:hypothetical protein [Nitrospira sp.]